MPTDLQIVLQTGQCTRSVYGDVLQSGGAYKFLTFRDRFRIPVLCTGTFPPQDIECGIECGESGIECRIDSQFVDLADHVGEGLEEEKEAAVCSAAAFLQSYYEKHHNLEDNIPEESEPFPKKARCNTDTVG